MNDLARRGLIVAGFCCLPWLVFSYWFDPEHGKLIGNDMLAYSFRQEYYFQVLFKNGYLPLWTPEILGGMPSAQLVLGQPFFPLSLLKLVIPGYFDGGHLLAFLSQKLLLLSLGGLAFYDFLRRKRLPRSPALLGALLFLFNSRMLDGIRYGTSFDAFVLVAPLLALIERALLGGFAPRLVLLVAPVVACQALAGYPQMLVYSVGLTNAYCAYRLITAVRGREMSRASAVRAGAWFVSAQALGLAMAAVSLLPFAADVLPYVRRNASFEFSTQHEAAWSDLAWSATYPWLADVHSAFYSSSIATILLVLLAAGWRGHAGQEAASTRRDLLFFAATVVVCVAIALGSHTPLFELLWRYVPGFDINRAPGRVLIVAQVAVATLCAFSLGRLLERPIEPRRFSWAWGGLFAFFALLTAGAVLLNLDSAGAAARAIVLSDVHRYSAYRLNGGEALLPRLLLQAALFPALLLALVAALRSRSAPRRVVLGALLAAVVLDASGYLKYGTWYRRYRDDSPGLRYFSQIDFFHERRVTNWFDTTLVDVPSSSDPALERSADPRVLAVLHLAVPAFKRTYFNDLRAARPYFPRAYWVPQLALVERDALSSANGLDPFRCAALDLSDEVNRGFSPLPAGVGCDVSKRPTAEDQSAAVAEFNATNATLAVLAYAPNRLTVRLEPRRPGALLYTDAHRPGWSARLDGRPVPIWRMNHAFKGVLLPAGAHEIEFCYSPWSFRAGLGVSLLASVCLLVLFAACGARRRALRLVLTALFSIPLAVFVYRDALTRADRGGHVGYQVRDIRLLLERNRLTAPGTAASAAGVP